MNFLSADVKISVDDSRLPAQLARARRNVTSTVGKIKASFSKMAASIRANWNKIARSAKIAAGIMIVGLALAVKAAMKQEDVEKRLAITLKATGYAAGFTAKELLKQASALQKVTRFGDETITAMHTMLLTFKNIKGDEFKRATEAALDMATAEAAVSGRTVDLTAASIRLGKALNDPILGITALSRVGVQFTEVQKDMIKELVKTGDVAGAQAVILKELEGEFGGMARDVDTASGALKQMWNALSDAAEKIGKALIPSITELGKSLTKSAEEGGAFEEFINETVEGVTALVEALNWLDRKVKDMDKAPMEILAAPVLPSKEWYMEKVDKIPAGIEAWEKAGRIPPQWMWSYIERAKEATALIKAATETQKILTKEVKETADSFQELTQEQRKAAEEIDQVWTEMWLEQEEKTFHAMRAPIIAAEEEARASAERRKRLAEDVAMSMARSWSVAIDQMMFEGKEFWDTMISMARSLIREIANIIIYKKLAEPMAYGLMGLPVPGTPVPAHAASGPTVSEMSNVFLGPSAQHGGTVEKTGWAKIHKGETFSGVNGGGMKVIINNTVSDRVDVSENFDPKQQVLNIFIEGAKTDGPTRRAIKQAAR